MSENKKNKTISLLQKLYNLFEAIPDSKTKYRLCWIIAISSSFGIILALNILTPLMTDDFCYLLIYGDYQTKISSIGDIIISQKNHYDLWGGRSVVHFIAQALLMLPPLLIDLLNTSVYLLYVFLIYYLIKGKSQHSLALFLLINVAVWFIQPAFGETILWVTGSANYLWGTVLVLLFILPYRLYNGGKNRPIIAILKALSFFFFGIIAGWTNENTGAAMIVIATLFILYQRYNKWDIPAWTVTGIIGAIIGYLIMILAPGNMERAGDAGGFDPLAIAYRLVIYTSLFVEYCGVLNLLYILFGILAWYFYKNTKSQTFRLSFIFLTGVLVSVYIMILSPSFPARAWFGVITFNLIALGIFFYNLDYRQIYFVHLKNAITVAMIVAFVFSTYPAFKDVYTTHRISQEREQIANQAKAEGKIFVEFYQNNPQTKYVQKEYIASANFMYSYYGIEVRFKEK